MALAKWLKNTKAMVSGQIWKEQRGKMVQTCQVCPPLNATHKTSAHTSWASTLGNVNYQLDTLNLLTKMKVCETEGQLQNYFKVKVKTVS